MKIIEVRNLLAGLDDWWAENEFVCDEATFHDIRDFVDREGLDPIELELVFIDTRFPLVPLGSEASNLYYKLIERLADLLLLIARRGPIGPEEEKLMELAEEAARIWRE